MNQPLPFLTKYGRSLWLFESPDGHCWKLAQHTLVKDFPIRWNDEAEQTSNRPAMPKLWFKNGRPTIPALAALPNAAKESFLVLGHWNQRPSGRKPRTGFAMAVLITDITGERSRSGKLPAKSWPLAPPSATAAWRSIPRS